ncbi:hypothetical protein BCR44DRAFT_1446556 [Catenaria anguillulae PL171]|uniref:VWFD domain-containing protein n=1 Tax=Catenaria anguillulae PL171 TaxID=765915 RepID=A0A1Y2H6B5_9FUNG|nr:hypothetical protein BCR44DRAFT_1446556 [Catenaria anguillulae PL171]
MQSLDKPSTKSRVQSCRLSGVVLASLALLAIAVLPANAFLNINTTAIDFASQSILQASLQVSLKSRPQAPVAVYFDAPRTRFSKCAMLFNETNWSRPRSLTVMAEAFLTQLPRLLPVREVPITFQGFSAACEPQFHNVTLQLPTRRGSGTARKCVLTGADPHIRPFGFEQWFTYSGAFGDVYLVHSPTLSIQARHSQCGPRSTCIHALGVRYGKSSFIIDGSRPERLLQALTSSMTGLTVSKTRSGTTTTLNIAFRCGSNLRMDVVNAGPFTYMNVYLTVPPAVHGNIGGVCGTFTPTSSDGTSALVGRGGRVFAADSIFAARVPGSPIQKGPPASAPAGGVALEYVDSWRVPESDNVFKNKTVVARPANLPARTTTCLRPNPANFSCTSSRPRRSIAIDVEGVESSDLDNIDVGLAETHHDRARRQLFLLSRWSSKNVFQPAYSILPIPFGFASVTSVSRYDGKEPITSSTWTSSTRRRRAPPTSPPPFTPPRAPATIANAFRQCSMRLSLIPSCAENIDEYIRHCQSNIRQGTHPKTAVELHKTAYAFMCAQQLLSQTMEPDTKVAQCAQTVVRTLGFGASGCRQDDRCLQCTEIGCIQCKDPSKYEVKAGQCVLTKRPEQQPQGRGSGMGADWTDDVAGAVDEDGEPVMFAPAPAVHLLSKKEVIKTSGSGNNDARAELLRQNPAINPAAIKSVDVI